MLKTQLLKIVSKRILVYVVTLFISGYADKKWSKK